MRMQGSTKRPSRGPEHGYIPGEQPGIDVRHVAQVTGVHKDHATAGNGGWGGVLQITHLQCGMAYIKLLTSPVSVQFHAKATAVRNIRVFMPLV